MNRADAEMTTDLIAAGIKAWNARAVAPLIARLAEVEARLAVVEGKSMTFQGGWQRAVEYPRGSAVVDRGALWAATRDTQPGQRPGESDAWQLAAKMGEPR